ncbi:MAG: CIA30 family protein [Gammaproteobacteria bacterium]|nr:CIA30 family protein [Gammaproteobacteria bacterium]
MLLTVLIGSLGSVSKAAAGDGLIDDRSSGTFRASIGSEWRLVSDRVMGGRSSGEMLIDSFQGRDCVRMQGDVSTENNGGFLQIALDLAAGKRFDASGFDGVLLQVAGNGERYNLHLRTSDLRQPWQSYRAGFVARADWSEIRIPFADLEVYRSDREFRPERLIRIGLVAIGREFEADLCVSAVRFYREE